MGLELSSRRPRSAAALALFMVLTSASSSVGQPPAVQPSEGEHAMFARFETERWLLAIPPIVKNNRSKYVVDTTAPLSRWELHSDLNFIKKENCETLRLRHFESYDPAKGYPSLSDQTNSAGRLLPTALRNSICVRSTDPALSGATIIQDSNSDEIRSIMDRVRQKICSEKGNEQLCGALSSNSAFRDRQNPK